MHSWKESNAKKNSFERKLEAYSIYARTDSGKTDKMLEKAYVLIVFSDTFNKLHLMARAHVKSCLSPTYKNEI